MHSFLYLLVILQGDQNVLKNKRYWLTWHFSLFLSESAPEETQQLPT